MLKKDVLDAQVAVELPAREMLAFFNLSNVGVYQGNFNAQLGSRYTVTTPFDDSSVTSRGTGKAYRLRLASGSYKNYPAGNNGIVTFVPLARQVDNACLSYDIRFSPTFDLSTKNIPT